MLQLYYVYSYILITDYNRMIMLGVDCLATVGGMVLKRFTKRHSNLEHATLRIWFDPKN